MLTVTIIKTLLMPPALQIILLLLGFIFWRLRRKLAILCLATGLISLWLLSTPVVSHSLYTWLEAPYLTTDENTDVNDEALAQAEAIVVLGGGRHHNATEYGHDIDTVSHQSLWRLRYAAYIANRLKLPVVVSGGTVNDPSLTPEAELGAQVLTSELGVYPVWQERESKNTWENAYLTSKLLEEKGIKNIILITHGYHMRRSSYSFTQAGVQHYPMITGAMSTRTLPLWSQRWLPTGSALVNSRRALHEYLGLLFYRLKYRLK